ncbi:Pre-rRNA-processing protein rix1 [Cytospora mali]|uniref:Pre-rRNA-processing protein RIX1 n=1 Tax=Cytospora mali TaxID=578113 RepID=A0A194VMA7_CYTMA|nr:Pre-rRNA-processing protein rix1 [Valsa mali]
MSLPPDLQVLCRRLTSTDPADLPALCPSLISHVHRCKAILSQPTDQKLKDGSPEASVLVHKLRTHLTTLLNNGRSQPGRFAAAILIKAIIDVGGWESLRTSEAWVRGLLTIVQKNDSYPAKEIAIITLTRIYASLHEYQALVREIATPTLPTFVSACLDVLKPPPTSKVAPPPLRLVETIANALCTITPLYPTTVRPSSARIKAAFRAYVAPTASDKLAAPHGLREASRQLFILQHYTTPKNGNAGEWATAVGRFISSSHATADQVFRAVQESWESNSGYVRKGVSIEAEPCGGGDSSEELPPWSGLSCGAERLIGLLETLGEFFRCPTKTPVTTPISAILNLTARITMILPPRKGSRSQDDIQLNSAIGREEKEELWSVLPDIHVAIMDLLIVLVQRMKDNAIPLAADILHQTVRIFDADQHIPLIRERGYVLIRELLLLHGPTLPKLSVNSLGRAVQSCCKDLLAASGHAPRDQKSGGKDAPAQKNNKASSSKASSNADAYLKTETNVHAATTDLSTTHLEACSALLPILLSHLPQQHLKQTLRALIDRTAVLSHNRDAMISSVLNQYRTPNGKALASVFPFLTRDFPRDQAVELLRSNLRAASWSALASAEDGDDEALLEQLQGESKDQEDEMEDEDVTGQKKWASGLNVAGAGDEDEEMTGIDGSAPQAGFNLSTSQEPTDRSTSAVETTTVVSETTVGKSNNTVMLSSTLKHKSEELEEPPAKRIDSGKAPEVFGGEMDVAEDDGEDSDGDSDGSVHLNATLDDDSEDEDEE